MPIKNFNQEIIGVFQVLNKFDETFTIDENTKEITTEFKMEGRDVIKSKHFLEYLAEKCIGLRIFEDENGKMNKGLTDVGGEIMLVSNFTLYADCSHGKRPSFINAARPEQAIPLYEKFKDVLRENGVSFVTGEFGADMQIDHVNDGPVTIIMDTDEMQRSKKNGN